MDRATAESLIIPRREKIVRPILTGHADVGGLDAGFLASLSSRSRYNNIWDRIKYRMILEFGLSGPVRWSRADDNPQLEFLFIDGAPEGIALRPKKGDRFNTLTSNYPTPYEKSLRVDQYVMFGAHPPAHLFATYTEDGNELDPQVERILVTSEYHAAGKNHIDWWFELYRADNAGSIQFPTGYDQPHLPGTGFAGKIKPARPATGTDTPGRIRPMGNAPAAEGPNAAEGDGGKKAEGGRGRG